MSFHATQGIQSSIPKRPKGTAAPLSLAQRRLWFLYTLNPSSTLYNISRAWRLKGRLNLPALTNTLHTILDRQEALRTVIQEFDGQAAQIIKPVPDKLLINEDLSFFPPAELEKEIDAFHAREAGRPFDLCQGPPVRFYLLTCGPDDHVFMVVVHHIVFDGWSLQRFGKELSHIYGQILEKGSPSLPHLPIQYSDFSYWQTHASTRDHFSADLAYWKSQLAGVPNFLELPTDFPRREWEKEQDGYLQFSISAQTLAKLKQVSQGHGVTLFMTLLGAFQILLAFYSGQKDILVGTPAASRNRVELEDLLGFFVNLLPLRTDLSITRSFCDVLAQVRRVCLKAYRHGGIPFEYLVEMLNPPRDASRHPVVQVIFQLRSSEDIRLDLPGLSTSALSVKRRTGNFDLHMVCEEIDSTLEGFLYFPRNLFSESSMIRLASHYQALLEGLVADPEKDIFRMSLVTEAEQHQLLAEWNPPISGDSPTLGIHHLFADQVLKTPHAVAVISGDSHLTYAALNLRANQLANYLRKRGVGPEVRVAVCLERSQDFLISLLGILKTGGSYVPLEPATPFSRLTMILSDSGASILLTHSRDLVYHSGMEELILVWEEIFPQLGLESSVSPSVPFFPLNLAYVIYTSGSSGHPKGVEISHESLLNLLKWHQETFKLSHLDHTSQLAGLAFDATGWELWPYLLVGASIHLPENETIRMTPRILRDWLITQQITIGFVPTPLAENLLMLPWPERVALRTMLTGGDTLTHYPPESIPFEVINNYGPTENTVVSTSGHIQWTSDSRRPPHIGQPILNTQVYVLDKRFHLQPIGLTGEIFIGGTGLARCYSNQPKLTAEKFLPHPYSGKGGARLYRTGDLACFLTDGNLNFLGRGDRQVKIRGFRIELGEIETVLLQHQEVRNAIVLCREDSPKEKSLVAYVVPRRSASFDPSTIRSYLGTRLPHYMIPSGFIQLDDIPLTANGKINRQALPKPDKREGNEDIAFVAPRNLDEELLAGIWAKALNIPRVGIHDNFFSLGGHSLIATQIISRIRSKFSVEFPLRSLFDFPTVADLAKELRRNTPDIPDIPTKRPGPTTSPKYLPLSLTQERFWILDQLPAWSRGYYISKMFRLKGELNAPALRQSFQDIVIRHEALRTTFPSIDGYPQQVISQADPLNIPLIEFSHLADSEKEDSLVRLIREEETQAFDLGRGPLFRIKLLRFAPQDHLLIMTLHHIICDARSIEILNDELATLYQAYSENKKSPLPPLTTQYSDFTNWQHKNLHKPQGVQDLEYWKRTLENPPPPLPLPTDYPRSQVQELAGHRLECWLSKEQTKSLSRLKQRTGTTFFMILLASLQLLISRMTGMTDILIGAPVAGRTHVDFEPLIGCFLNNLVLRTTLSEPCTFSQLLGQVREKVLGALTHQETPFEKLLDVVPFERHAGRTPLFQVLLNMHDFSDKELSLPGLHASFVPSLTVKSLFDWTLYFQEYPKRINLQLVYNAGLFSEPRMQETLNQLTGLLEQVAEDPDLPLHRYSLVTNLSRRTLPDPTLPLEEPLQEDVPTLICRQAEAFPNHIAMSQGKQTWTYKELITRTLTLAQALQKHGLQPGEVVAVGGYRSLGLVTALFSILQAGGVIMPLDARLPPHRQRLMIQEAGAKRYVWIGHDPTPDISADGDAGIHFHRLDPESGIFLDERPSEHSLSTSGHYHPQPDDPAYIFFTSGTTGNPKGILGRHKSLSHFLKWQAQTFKIGPGDRVAQLTALSFDAVLRDIFLSLISGATVCLPEDQLELAPDQVIPWIDHEGITILHAVPTVARFWIRHVPEETRLSSLRWTFFSGEPVSDALVNQWRRSFPESGQLVNFYGPTETTLIKSWYVIPDPPSPGIQPIGYPMPQTQILIMGPDNRLCGTGEIGEIVIRTPFGTHGYINMPSPQQERFFQNPYRHDSTDQCYRTGDHGRYRLNGSVDILGRLDNQIKIRGVRIEPEEITSLLQRHPDLEAAAVLGHVEEDNENFLVAYVVPKSNTPRTEQSLRSFLASKVPAAMVPSSFVFLDSLPVTRNGKLDRRALPVPSLGSPTRRTSFVEPRTSIEKTLVDILIELFSVEQIGINDNFFELGGHSLLAMQVINRIEKIFHTPFSLRYIFETPTIGEWAQYLEEISSESQALPIESHSLKNREEGLI
ncbi:MAG: amino acid adenylation domain-containing protein [Nitrospirales bacterium]